MKGLRSNRLEDKLLWAIQDGDDVLISQLERRILQKQRKDK